MHNERNKSQYFEKRTPTLDNQFATKMHAEYQRKENVDFIFSTL